MKAYWQLVVMNFKMLFRAHDALFWNFAFPVVFMILMGTAFGRSPAFTAHVGIEGTGVAKTALDQVLHHVSGVSVNVITHGIKALKSGRIDLLARISGRHIRLITTNSQVSRKVLSIVQGSVMALNLQAFHLPPVFVASVRRISMRGNSYIDFLAPGILGMTLMNTGLLSGAALITYRSQGILRRIRGTPLSTSTFIAARITMQLTMALVQAALIIFVARSLYHFKPAGDIWDLVPFLILGEFAFMTLGFVIAGIANTMEMAIALTNLIGLPMMFLAGVFYPVSQLPAFLKPLTEILPLRYLTSALRAVVSHGASLAHLRGDLVALALMALICGFLAIKCFRWEMPHG